MDNQAIPEVDNQALLTEKTKTLLLAKPWLQAPKRWLFSLRSQFSELTLSQWLYLAALVLLIFNADQALKQNSELWWVGIIAGVGLIRELWQMFNRIWESRLGKGLILVLYAATANFALAVSALKINVITGIEPIPFVFTLGFATLIMLPFWILISSIIFFSVALIAGNIWLVIGLLLRLIKIKVKIHWEDKSFVFITMLLRIVLIPYVIATIFFISVPYAKQIELFEKPIEMFQKETQGPKKVNEKSAEPTKPDIKVTLNNSNISLPVNEKGTIKWLDKLIASFIYYFETYPKSACKKLPTERSLPIDENMILLVAEDDSALGYQFWVAPCEGNYTHAEQPQSIEN